MKDIEDSKIYAGDSQERNTHRLNSDKKLNKQKIDFLKRYYFFLNSGRNLNVGRSRKRGGNIKKVSCKPTVPIERFRRIKTIYAEQEKEPECSRTHVQTVNDEYDRDYNLFEKGNSLPIETVEKTFRTARNDVEPCVASFSAPAILNSLEEHKPSPDTDRRNTRAINHEHVVANQKQYFNKFGIHSKKNSSKTRKNVMIIEDNKNLKVKDVSIIMFKKPSKYLRNRKIKVKDRKELLENDSITSADETEHIFESETPNETATFSSYSESEIKFRLTEMLKRKYNFLRNRTDLNRCSLHGLYNCTSLRCRNFNTKQITKALRYDKNEVTNPIESFHLQTKKSHSKNSVSSYSTDSFLKNELSRYKEFLIKQCKMQKSKVVSKKARLSPYIPNTVRMEVKNGYCNRKDYSTYTKKKETIPLNYVNYPHTGISYFSSHLRRQRVSDEELWHRFGILFRSYASTKKFSGEVIPRKISTEWMVNMGVVSDLMTKKDAEDAFRKAAGQKITMNILEYKEFLLSLSTKKKLPLYELYRRMCGI
ncbi:uncharacterized protein NPIL_510941 [Nephila pilipes]|uniref:Uncharacterized protein n=1 Tax=Nephila pilipes TaxID=299642 RepID=A0A8X6U1C5_NEPPI|nr:uncharacterized protein NPIL_510941 [Nephila pilipes]